MQLLHPNALWFLVLIGLPILIHLFLKRRSYKKLFPAILLLMQSDAETKRRRKLKQLLLFLSRVMLFLLLPLALAQPHCTQDSEHKSALPAGVVILLDDSLSMRASEGGTSRYERALVKVEDYLQEVDEADEVVLMTTSSSQSAHSLRFGTRADALAALESLGEAGYGRADMVEGLQGALELVQTSSRASRKILIVSDFAETGWESAPNGELVGGLAEVALLNVGGALNNLALSALQVAPDPTGREDEWQVEVGVEAFGEIPEEPVEITLSVNQEVVERASLRLREASTTKAFSIHLPYEEVEISAEISREDPLPEDNRRGLMVKASRRARILIVSGEPATLRHLDEAFYLERALHPGAESSSPFLPQVITAPGLARQDLERFEVVILANCRELSPEVVEPLRRFVEEGGGLFISAGPRVEAKALSERLKDLLPRRLRGPKVLAELSDPDAAIKVSRLETLAFNHPVLQAFRQPEGAELKKAQVYAYLLVEPEARPESEVLISFADGSPALIERAVGRGRVLLWTTSLDRDWTDLPLRKSYLPLLRKIVSYLAKLDQRIPGEGFVGEALTVPGGGGVATGPGGEERWEGDSFIPSRPGRYLLQSEGELASVSINLDVRESDLRPMEADRLASLWEAPLQLDARNADFLVPREARIWPWLLLGGLLALLIESALGFKRRTWRFWR